MFPQPDTGTELSAIGEGAGEGGEREGIKDIAIGLGYLQLRVG